MTQSERGRTRLYLISPPTIELESFVDSFEAALQGGDIACFQLRLKVDDTAANDDDIAAATERLQPIAAQHEVAFLMNDRPDLAASLGCDGVHIGQSDMGLSDARRVLGNDAIVGVTCHASRHLALDAAEKGADYVAFGAFHPTATKSPKASADPEILTWWQQIVELPCVAIGGITTDNAAPLIEAGADFLAVSAGIWSHPDGPSAAVAAFNRLFDDRSVAPPK